MRIFIFILSLIFSAAFVLLNVLGFNGVLTLNEFFLVNVVAEVLVCLVLGHFMFRTYANHKKLKKLQQEMATRQASSVAHEQATKKKHTLKRKKKENVPTSEATSPKQQTPAPQQSMAPQQATTQLASQPSAQRPTTPQAPQQQTPPRAPQQPSPHPAATPTAQQDPRKAPAREQAPIKQPTPSNTTQPMQPVRSDNANLDATALYNTPFGK